MATPDFLNDRSLTNCLSYVFDLIKKKMSWPDKETPAKGEI